jgi:hypothetical protein
MTDYSCPEHSDCTVTVYEHDGEEIGRRHLHQWIEDRAGTVVVCAMNVGLYLGDTDGAPVFDPTAIGWVEAYPDDPTTLADDLNVTYPWADDHRSGEKLVGPKPVKLPKAAKPKVPTGDLKALVAATFTAPPAAPKPTGGKFIPFAPE